MEVDKSGAKADKSGEMRKRWKCMLRGKSLIFYSVHLRHFKLVFQ